jgi:catechol 2,3-dioxygenase-like lactoylglutathione lyase family enzyme
MSWPTRSGALRGWQLIIPSAEYPKAATKESSLASSCHPASEGSAAGSRDIRAHSHTRRSAHSVAYDLPVTTAEVPLLSRTGFIDHIGIGVPDLVVAKEYYDDLVSVLGLREWFETGPGGPLNYGPDGALGSQLFFYQAEEPDIYSRLQTGLHHVAFLVASRAVVREAHQWARTRDAVILDEPREFPQYGPHCFATYWLDPHGFKLEAVCHTPEES